MKTTNSPIVDAASLRRFKKATNFFETPEALADRMAFYIDDIGHGAKILEPSAGRGALIRAVHRAIKYEIAPIDFCETNEDMADEMSQWGGNRKVGSDFTALKCGPVYSAVIMNPPYANKQAEAHTDHAWNCIKPGGRIVTLVGRMAAEYIDIEFSGHVFEREEIPKGTFAETNISTVLYLIHKPLAS